MTDLQKRLFQMQDLGYKDFHSKLMPAVSPDKIIGIRVPELRRFAKDFSKTDESQSFLQQLPHKYYEEDNLHAFTLEEIKDYDTAVSRTEVFLPYIDNWATCDMFVPKVFKKNTDKLLDKIRLWIRSGQTYTVRYAIGLLMKLYLDDKFSHEYPQMVAAIKSDEYYVNMMIAWYFATALAKQYDAALPYLTGEKLDIWTHNKTIRKACESYRISPDIKAYLKTLKR